MSLDVWFDVRLLSHRGKTEVARRRGAAERAVSRAQGETLNLHASAVAVDGRGCLILGASGSGKSTLALSMIALGAELTADDRTIVRREGARLYASAPPNLAGIVEVRGIGLLRAPVAAPVPLELVVDLDRPAEARMPQAREIAYLGVGLELIFAAEIPNLSTIVVHMLRYGRAP